MNERNVEYLEKQMLSTGFGDIPREQLINRITEDGDSFKLSLTKKYGADEATATLNFNKSDKGNYFFNNYDLVIKNDASEEAFKQRFKMNYGNSYTFKEAFNLMQGRSVFKDFIKVDRENQENNQKYSAWATMDFKQADEDGNHAIKKTYRLKLEEALAEYPFKELANNQYKNDLISSLQRGNRQSVTYLKDGVETKMKIEANPTHNGLKLYDDKDNPIRLSMKAKAVEQAQEQNQEQNQGVTPEANAETRQGQRHEEAAGQEDGPTGRGRGRGRRAA